MAQDDGISAPTKISYDMVEFFRFDGWGEYQYSGHSIVLPCKGREFHIDCNLQVYHSAYSLYGQQAVFKGLLRLSEENLLTDLLCS